MIDVKKIHSYSFENKKSLEKVNKCGCFYCLKIFNPEEIEEWVEDKKDYTAICPYCGIDSIIPLSVINEYELNTNLLEIINKEYF